MRHDPPEAVTIELFGIPRSRAGVEATECLPGTLGEILAELGRRFPGLEADCLSAGGLRPTCAANLNGRRFVRDPATPLVAGDRLLLLSADAGG